MRKLTLLSALTIAIIAAGAAARAAQDEQAEQAEDRQAETKKERRGAQPAQPAPPPSADEVLGKMLKPRLSGRERELNITDPPLPDRTSGKAAVMPNAPVVQVMREGTPIVNRVGRLTFSADGTQAELTFESDGQRLQDPPLILLPNLKLMAMEDHVRAASRDLRFRVSGVVTEYRGRNYLLLEKATVIQDVTQQYK
jgi:hypothetical protein